MIEEKSEKIKINLIGITKETAGSLGKHGNFINYKFYRNGEQRELGKFCSVSSYNDKGCKFKLIVDSQIYNLNFDLGPSNHLYYYCFSSTCLENLHGNHQVTLKMIYNGKEVYDSEWIDFDTGLK